MRALLPSLSVSFVPDVHLNFRLFHTPSHSHAKSESLVNAKVNAPDSEAIRRRNKIIAPWQKLHAFTYTFLLFERPLIKKFLCIEVSVHQTITTPLSHVSSLRQAPHTAHKVIINTCGGEVVGVEVKQCFALLVFSDNLFRGRARLPLISSRQVFIILGPL